MYLTHIQGIVILEATQANDILNWIVWITRTISILSLPKDSTALGNLIVPLITKTFQSINFYNLIIEQYHMALVTIASKTLSFSIDKHGYLGTWYSNFYNLIIGQYHMALVTIASKTLSFSINKHGYFDTWYSKHISKWILWCLILAVEHFNTMIL